MEIAKVFFFTFFIFIIKAALHISAFICYFIGFVMLTALLFTGDLFTVLMALIAAFIGFTFQFINGLMNAWLEQRGDGYE